MTPNIQRANSKSPCPVFLSAFYTPQGGGGILGHSDILTGRSVSRREAIPCLHQYTVALSHIIVYTVVVCNIGNAIGGQSE